MFSVTRASRAAPLNRPVLVIGERGTGKELIAERLHHLSGRWAGPLVTMNCAALPENLIEAELFGHEAGSFTGAAKTRHFARIHEASGCSAADTLFFDDMADNVAVASRAGVTCVLLPSGGLPGARLEEGLQAWRRARAAGGR